MRIKLVALASAAALGPAAYAAVSHAATPADPDGDGDLVCPVGQTNPSYCSEDERGPAVSVSPKSLKVPSSGKFTLRFRCSGHATSRCTGRATITTTKRVRRGRRFRTVTVGVSRKSFSLVHKVTTSVKFQMSSASRTLLRSKKKLSCRVAITARQGDSRTTTSRAGVLLKKK